MNERAHLMLIASRSGIGQGHSALMSKDGRLQIVPPCLVCASGKRLCFFRFPLCPPSAALQREVACLCFNPLPTRTQQVRRGSEHLVEQQAGDCSRQTAIPFASPLRALKDALPCGHIWLALGEMLSVPLPHACV